MSSEPLRQDTTSMAGFYSFERQDSDLPFYRGVPVAIGAAGWLAVLFSVAAAYAALIFTQPMLHEGLPAFIPPLLFVSIPLIFLAAIAGPGAPAALFRPFRRTDVLIIFGFLLLNWIVTIALGMVAITFLDANANPAGGLAAGASGLNRLVFFGWTAVQIVGEEIFTILPFLAFLTFLDRRAGRKLAIALAALGVSIIFALIHLPAYQWNLPQVLVGLVPIRLVLLMPYIMTRNLWVSAAVHVLNDALIFGFGIFAAGAGGG